MQQPLISVVVPCFNEHEVIRATHARLVAALESAKLRFELLYVDDGSRDATLAILRELQAGDDRVRVRSFARNFGHQVAVTAGLARATGDAVVLIDADLQDPPEMIPQMVELWQQGFEVVYGQRRKRAGETFFKRATASAFYRVINRLSSVAIPVDTGDFRLMDRRVVEALNAMPERDRFVRGLVSWIGFTQTALPYDRDERFAGETKYPLKKMLRFAMDAILSFSIMPLQLTSLIGLATCGLSFLGICYAVFMRLFTDIWVSGWTLLFVSVLFLGGIQLIALGVLGEYIGRIYLESKQRPLYIVAREYGFAGGAAQGQTDRRTSDSPMRGAS